MDGIPRIEACVAAPTVPEKGTAMPELSVSVSTQHKQVRGKGRHTAIINARDSKIGPSSTKALGPRDIDSIIHGRSRERIYIGDIGISLPHSRRRAAVGACVVLALVFQRSRRTH